MFLDAILTVFRLFSDGGFLFSSLRMLKDPKYMEEMHES